MNNKLFDTQPSLEIQSSLPTKSGDPELDKLFDKGLKLAKTSQFDKAAETFAAILKRKPDHFATVEQLGLLSRRMDNHEKALIFFKALTEHVPTYAQGYGYTATTLMSLENYEDAILYLKKAIPLGNYAFIYHGLGHCYRYLGNKEEAKKSFYKALQIEPETPKILYSYLFFFYDFEDKDDEYLERVHGLLKAKRKSMDVESLAALYTILYKAYEDLGDYDQAITYAGKAGQARLKECSYSVSANEKSCDIIRNYFDDAFFKNTKTSGVKTHKPVFILAMPRSGTTLLEQILHSHKDVIGIGEDGHFGDLLEKRSALKPHNNIPYMYRIKNPSGESWDLERIANTHISYLEQKTPGSLRAVDKAIAHYTWVAMLYLCFPDAYFIHLTRDPLSSAISSYTRNFVFNHHPYTNDLYKMGVALRLHYDIMSHWKKVIPAKILDVSYEDIVEDTESQARRIIDFLELDWDESCLNFHKTKKIVKTASADQVRKKIYKSSLKTWQKYDKHLAPLIEGLGSYAPEESLYILEKYGKNHEDNDINAINAR